MSMTNKNVDLIIKLINLNINSNAKRKMKTTPNG